MGDAETTSGLLLGPAFGSPMQTTLPRKGLSLNPFSRAKQLQKLDGQGSKAPATKVSKNSVSDLGTVKGQGINASTTKVTKRVVPMNLVSDLGTADQFPPKMSPFYEMIVESMEDTRILHESAGLTVDGKPIQRPAARSTTQRDYPTSSSQRGERSNTVIQQQSNTWQKQATVVSHRNQIPQSMTSKGKGAIKRHKQNISKIKPPQLCVVLKPPVETCADLVIRSQPGVNLPLPNPINISSASMTMSTGPDGGMRYDIARAIVLCYPATRGVSLSQFDLDCLLPGRYINDNVMEFALRFWWHALSSETASEIHIFNSFFFKKLNGVDGFEGVKKWTRDVDVFAKKFLVVPVHEEAIQHWYLAIVYLPKYTLEDKSNTSPIPADEGTSSEVQCTNTTIFVMDSLGRKHADTISILSQYLVLEAKDKKKVNSTRTINGGSIPALKQPNAFDCGLYTVLFAEIFVTQASYFHRVLLKLISPTQSELELRWQSHKIQGMRDRLRSIVQNMSKVWLEQQANGISA